MTERRKEILGVCCGTVAACELACVVFFGEQFAMRKWVYFTVLSNVAALLACVAVCVSCATKSLKKEHCRLLVWATCMTTFTLAVVLLGGASTEQGYQNLLLEGSSLFVHTLCPIAMICIVVALVPRQELWRSIADSVCTTLCYGVVMYALNGRGIIVGPYYFFEVLNLTTGKLFAFALLLVALSVGTTTALHLLHGERENSVGYGGKAARERQRLWKENKH